VTVAQLDADADRLIAFVQVVGQTVVVTRAGRSGAGR